MWKLDKNWQFNELYPIMFFVKINKLDYNKLGKSNEPLGLPHASARVVQVGAERIHAVEEDLIRLKTAMSGPCSPLWRPFPYRRVTVRTQITGTDTTTISTHNHFWLQQKRERMASSTRLESSSFFDFANIKAIALGHILVLSCATLVM